MKNGLKCETLSGLTFEEWISAGEKQRIRREVKALSKLKPIRAFAAIAFDYGIIFISVYIGLHFQNIIIDIFFLFVIGSRQHALLILMHDGAHNRLVKNKKHNLFVSNFFCSFPLLITTGRYSQSHLAHHKYLNTDKDPDLSVKKNTEWSFPKTKKEIYFILLRQFFCLGILKKLYRFGVKNKTVHIQRASFGKEIFRLSYYIALASVLSWLHLWLYFVCYWIVPALTVLPVLLRVRSLAEHFGLDWEHELTSSRNVKANSFSKFFIAPHNVNYHLLHHLYPSVPFYNLDKLHKFLMRNEIYRNYAAVSDGYLKSKHSVVTQLTMES